MSFIGAGTDTKRVSFYSPEPQNADLKTWAEYPAIQDIDVNNNDIVNVNNITANNVIATEKEVQNLTVLNDLNVNNNVSVVGLTMTHGIDALGNITTDGGTLLIQQAVEDTFVNLTVLNTDEDGFPPDADQGSALNLGGCYIGSNDATTTFGRIIGGKESASNYSDGYFVIQTNRDQDRAFGGSPQLFERLRVDSEGNVGIGTSTPGSKLTINGDASIENDVVIQNGGLIVKDPTATVSAKIYCRNLAINGGNQDLFDTTTTSDLVSLPRLSHSPQITLSADFTLGTTGVAIHKFIDFNSGAYILTLNLPAFKETDNNPAITHRILCANASSGSIKFQSTAVATGNAITASNIFYLRPKNSGSKVVVNSPYTYAFNDAFYLIEASTTGGSNGEWMISIM